MTLLRASASDHKQETSDMSLVLISCFTLVKTSEIFVLNNRRNRKESQSQHNWLSNELILTWSRWMQSHFRGKIVELIFSRGIKQQKCSGMNSKYITLATSTNLYNHSIIYMLYVPIKNNSIPKTADFYRRGRRSCCQHTVCFIV